MENSIENETLEEFKLQIDSDSAASKGELAKKEISISELKEVEKNIEECKEKIMSIIKLQTFCRGRIARKHYNKTKSDALTKEQNEKKNYLKDKDRWETITKSIFDFSTAREKRTKYIFKSGATYEGEWKGGFRDGFGTQIWPDGASYTGEWSFNYAHGKGKLTHVDGDIYEGEWKNDKANGYGEYQHSNGANYAGYWKNDLQCGRGIEKWTDGSFYDGLYLNGQKHVFGIYVWADKSKFMGQWKENKICGIGLYTWTDGRSYKGEWKDNNMNGCGIYNWHDGMINKHGFGVYYWPDGRRYEGLWSNSKQHGVGRYLVPTEGSNKIGVWKEGVRKCWIEGENIEKLTDKYFQGGITLDNNEIMCNEDEGLDFSKVRMYFYDSAQFQKFVESVINKVDHLLKEHSDILSKYEILN